MRGFPSHWACLCKDDIPRFYKPKSNLTGCGNGGGVPSPFRGGLGRGMIFLKLNEFGETFCVDFSISVFGYPSPSLTLPKKGEGNRTSGHYLLDLDFHDMGDKVCVIFCSRFWAALAPLFFLERAWDGHRRLRYNRISTTIHFDSSPHLCQSQDLCIVKPHWGGKGRGISKMKVRPISGKR